MSHRHHGLRRPDNKPSPFAGADSVITEMEAAVAYRTVTCDFTVEDAIQWLWPLEAIEALRHAHQYIEHKYRNHMETVQLPPPLPQISFSLELKNCGMVSPEDGICLFGGPADMKYRIEDAIRTWAHVHKEFNKVRRVVSWLNEHATVGYARHVFPQMRALLPENSPFHEADGLRYKEPLWPISEIADTLRECGAIVTGGILAGTVENERKLFGVQVHNMNGLGDSKRFYMV
jgi:hypothetical protein